MYTIRFWNRANENIMVGGKYSHTFNTPEEAWDSANALLISAVRYGAVEMDMNNEFYEIIND